MTVGSPGAAVAMTRESQFPFLSSDGLRAIAEVVIDGDSIIRRRPITPRRVFFLRNPNHVLNPADLTPEEDQALTRIRELVPKGKPPFGSLIVGESDAGISRGFAEECLSIFENIYASNVPYLVEGLEAIPVGIENAYYQRNGVYSDFESRRDLSVAEDLRPNDVFACFNVATNPVVRGTLASEVTEAGMVFYGNTLSPAKFRQGLADSYFVLSPPGNGLDCHRTWEAIYFGAVPVIQRGTLSSSLAGDLPILEVADYREFLRLSSYQKRQIFAQLRSTRSDEKAYLTYWVGEIVRSG